MIRFKTASTLQAFEIAKLVNSAYRGEYSEQGWTTEAAILGGQRTDPEGIINLINAPLNQIEIAYDENSQHILGCVHIIQELADTLYFGMLTIEPTLQGQGHGKILLDHIEGIAKIRGLKRIRCTVIPLRTELIAFYERRGFVATGGSEPFPVDDPRFGLPKISGLSLKEYAKLLAS
jgi:ribosomal protein S18 acetylase RimI-like enzyme